MNALMTLMTVMIMLYATTQPAPMSATVRTAIKWWREYARVSYLGYKCYIDECIDDECIADTDDCDDNAICNNTAGSYECYCKDGYQMVEGVCTGELPRLQMLH